METQQTLNDILNIIRNSGMNLVVMAIMFFLGVLTVRNIMKIVKMALVSSKLDKALVNFILTIVRFLLYLILMMHALNHLGVSITGMVTTLSAVTLAIGLAIQNIIAGIANGILLAVTHPFKVNDIVDIEGNTGTVQEINLIHTVIHTFDGKIVYIPNNTVYSSTIVNISSNDVRRIDLTISTDYEADQERIREILLALVDNNELILDTPAPEDHYNMTDASSITHILRFWVKTENYWKVTWDMTELTFEVLKSKGFNVPYQQITVGFRDKEDRK
jgi:small conductance mechanosensitive channel